MLKSIISRINKLVQSPRWFWGFILAVGVCKLAYLSNYLLSEISPGSAWGLTYGILAATLMAGAGAFGIRRRITRHTKKFSGGRAQTWVQFHVYAGTLSLLLVLMHSGFRLPTGTLTWWLFILSIWVAVSGLFGVFLQKWIPRLLTSGLTIEVVYERIPDLVREIRDRSEELLKLCTDPVKEFYRKNIAAALRRPQLKLVYYFDITGGVQSQIRQFDYLSRVLSAEEKTHLHQLQTYYKTKLEIDAHYTLQKALRWWLYLHVPASLVLILLIGLHIYAVWYY
jgi:hypothetical protein